MAEEIGQVGLRKEVVDKAIKGFATQQYKFKPVLTISPSNGWVNTFYRENPSVLTAPTANAVKGIARGANFPQASVNWTKVSSEAVKYGIEDNIFWEDVLTDNIDVQTRTMFRIAERVTKAVDDEIWATLTESQAPTNIGSVMIGAGSSWNGANPNVIDDLMAAKQYMGEWNYNTSKCTAFISPKDERSIANFIVNHGAQFPSISTSTASDGKINNIAGIDLVTSNSVTANYAAVVVPKVCATWKAAVPLMTETIVDPMKSIKIRACEIGVTQLTDPHAVVLISGTQL